MNCKSQVCDSPLRKQSDLKCREQMKIFALGFRFSSINQLSARSILCNSCSLHASVFLFFKNTFLGGSCDTRDQYYMIFAQCTGKSHSFHHPFSPKRMFSTQDSRKLDWLVLFLRIYRLGSLFNVRSVVLLPLIPITEIVSSVTVQML